MASYLHCSKNSLQFSRHSLLCETFGSSQHAVKKGWVEEELTLREAKNLVPGLRVSSESDQISS